jgi:NAD(P)-dependent dehydrogenase (short-subunit alcohol dehydrogenase family)
VRDLAGKTAFVTGGASGIGLAMGRAFAAAGMKVMFADVETKALDEAVASCKGDNLPEVRGVPATLPRSIVRPRPRSMPSARSMSSATTLASAAPPAPTTSI